MSQLAVYPERSRDIPNPLLELPGAPIARGGTEVQHLARNKMNRILGSGNLFLHQLSGVLGCMERLKQDVAWTHRGWNRHPLFLLSRIFSSPPICHNDDLLPGLDIAEMNLRLMVWNHLFLACRDVRSAS
jgi:hypothetical protein